MMNDFTVKKLHIQLLFIHLSPKSHSNEWPKFIIHHSSFIIQIAKSCCSVSLTGTSCSIPAATVSNVLSLMRIRLPVLRFCL